MRDVNETQPSAEAEQKRPAGTQQSGDAGRKAQTDEARDEGAGKIAVPVDQTSTANDK